MLEQSYQSNSSDNFENCDTTTNNSSCLTTPFSVKDILNLNMMNENNLTGSHLNYVNLNSIKCEYNYEDYNNPSFVQNHCWDNSFAPTYDHFNYSSNYYNPVDLNIKCDTASYGNKDFTCENSTYGSTPSHVQQLTNLICAPYQEKTKENEFSGLESPSK